MLVISRALVLTRSVSYDADNPIIGWENIVTGENITADTEDSDYPATNLGNSSTSSEWRGADTSVQYLTVATGEVDPIDYLGVARHNFGTEGITVSVEGRTSGGGSWAELVEATLLADDSPVMFLFEPQSLFEIRLKMQTGSAVPRAAILRAGPTLTMERGMWIGHTPLKYARRVSAIDGLAESGDYLGSVVLGEYRESTAHFDLLNPDWYRANMEPFLASAVSQREPFFFSWRPATYPLESGFARIINNPDPVPTEPSHLLEIDLQMRGVA